MPFPLTCNYATQRPTSYQGLPWKGSGHAVSLSACHDEFHPFRVLLHPLRTQLKITSLH